MCISTQLITARLEKKRRRAMARVTTCPTATTRASASSTAAGPEGGCLRARNLLRTSIRPTTTNSTMWLRLWTRSVASTSTALRFQPFPRSPHRGPRHGLVPTVLVTDGHTPAVNPAVQPFWRLDRYHLFRVVPAVSCTYPPNNRRRPNYPRCARRALPGVTLCR